MNLAASQGLYNCPNLGEGVFVGISSDGAAAYATAERPESGEVGCEGSPAQFLFYCEKFSVRILTAEERPGGTLGP